ncbi:hypothetical protein SAMN02745166_03042 [Prosthecobacter debontii]|uniref:Toprim domain-containing protein n=1 Tax=Prosthecobacter debontii TaxID=48467 RepID=A0A1T4YDR9_9BACT|nr:hypothetical protein [Prosthecobacter debontii]SKA99833.1 hypothetical protein SAMN02745166_03042 [Prosthecobacter debontii]
MSPLDRAAAYLQHLPPAISGSGGHSATYRAACALVQGFALGETDALPLLQAWNHSHCQPPWTERELRHKLRSATQSSAHAQRPLGYLLNEDRPRAPTARACRQPSFFLTRTLGTMNCEHETNRQAQQRQDWPAFRPLKPALIERIAQQRGMRPDAVDLAQRHGFLSGGLVDGQACYLLHEGSFAQARRLDGEPFWRADGSPLKAKNLPGSEGAFIGQRWLGSATHVLLVEGAIALIEALAAWALVDAPQPWAILAATSASSRFARDPALLHQLRGKHLRLVPDADASGLKAAAAWLAELDAGGISVDVYALPEGCKDLAPLITPSGHAQHADTLSQLFMTEAK